MNDQQKNEVIKALAYGRTLDEIVQAENVELAEIVIVKTTCSAEIEEMREQYKNGGYIND